MWLQSIDYRCADGRFLMSPWDTAVPKTRYLSGSETRVNAGIRGWKLHLSESTSCQESAGGICFTYKVKSSFSTVSDIFKPLLKCSIFKCISWLNGSFFWGWTSGFSETRSQGLSNGANVASQLANFFFCLHIYSLCFKVISWAKHWNYMDKHWQVEKNEIKSYQDLFIGTNKFFHLRVHSPWVI